MVIAYIKCSMLRNKPSSTFEGNHFKVKDARLTKRTQQHNTIPITVAAKKDNTMRIAAKYAHVWECSFLTPEQFTTLNERFENICREINRNGDRIQEKTIRNGERAGCG